MATIDDALLMLGDDCHVMSDGIGRFFVLGQLPDGEHMGPEGYRSAVAQHRGPVEHTPTAALLAWAESEVAWPLRSRALIGREIDPLREPRSAVEMWVVASPNSGLPTET